MTEAGSTTTTGRPAPSTLVDPGTLAGWLDEQGLGRGPVEVDWLGEGHSNLTFAVRRGEAAWVLRRPPRGPLLPTAHDVVREFRVLSVLSACGAPVRVPRVVAICEDTTVIGVPFFLMERVEGAVVRDRLPAFLAGSSCVRTRHALGLDLADALAEIHCAPPEPFVAVGLGRPDGYLRRQLRRWAGQREGVRQAVAAQGARARDLPDYDAVRDWLSAHLPSPSGPPTLVHGDYKLDNVIVGPEGRIAARVRAVVDWEMATVGEPLADLGYLLSFWLAPGETLPLAELVTTADGFPTRAELVARWAASTRREPRSLDWFITLAVWKLAILLEASYHRWLAGEAEDPFFARLEAGVPALFRRARDVCGA
ncbi:MAG: phosphotransferase family protein [Mycobacterium leprae]